MSQKKTKWAEVTGFSYKKRSRYIIESLDTDEKWGGGWYIYEDFDYHHYREPLKQLPRALSLLNHYREENPRTQFRLVKITDMYEEMIEPKYDFGDLSIQVDPRFTHLRGLPQVAGGR